MTSLIFEILKGFNFKTSCWQWMLKCNLNWDIYVCFCVFCKCKYYMQKCDQRRSFCRLSLYFVFLSSFYGCHCLVPPQDLEEGAGPLQAIHKLLKKRHSVQMWSSSSPLTNRKDFITIKLMLKCPSFWNRMFSVWLN